MPLAIKPPDQCRWDAVALGEVMLRLDPGGTSMVTLKEVEAVMKAKGARVIR